MLMGIMLVNGVLINKEVYNEMVRKKKLRNDKQTSWRIPNKFYTSRCIRQSITEIARVYFKQRKMDFLLSKRIALTAVRPLRAERLFPLSTAAWIAAKRKIIIYTIYQIKCQQIFRGETMKTREPCKCQICGKRLLIGKLIRCCRICWGCAVSAIWNVNDCQTCQEVHNENNEICN